jgi:two-component system, NarL family, response regulator LiaR
MGSKIRIVILDDDHEVVTEWMQPGLDRYEDIEVVAVCTIEHGAIGAIEKHKPDVVLIDLVWNGNDTVGKRLASEVHRKTPGIAVVAYSIEPKNVYDPEVYADYRLVKPISKAVFADAIRNANQLVRGRIAQRPQNKYSPRDIDTLKCMALGMKDREIAVKQGIAPDTVRDRVSDLLSRMEAPNRAAAVAKALSWRIIDDMDI